jgi:hypothetical protein
MNRANVTGYETWSDECCCFSLFPVTGWLSEHDVAIPQSRANGNHLLVGPPGVFQVDSKA